MSRRIPTLAVAALLSLCLAATAYASAPADAGAAAGPGEKAGDRLTALRSTVLLKVVHPLEARRAIVEKVKSIGGFPTLVTDTSLELKVPPARLSEVVQFATEQGLVVDKSLERADLTQQVAQLEAQLRSKRRIFRRLRKFIDDSDVAATLQIERNMTALVQELESVRGRLRVERERAGWARVEVSFQFRERDRIIYVESPFSWINTVDLDQFLRGF